MDDLNGVELLDFNSAEKKYEDLVLKGYSVAVHVVEIGNGNFLYTLTTENFNGEQKSNENDEQGMQL